MTGKKGDSRRTIGVKELTARLQHDVGKYVSRTARNLGPGEVPSGLIALLVVDLFAIDGRRTALKLFEALAAPLFESGGDGRLLRCRSLLQRIETLEQPIRNGEQEAVRQAADMALEVDRLLRELSRSIQERDH